MRKIYLILATLLMVAITGTNSFANKFAPTGLTSAGGSTYHLGTTATALSGTITKTSCATGTGGSVTGTIQWYYNTTNSTSTVGATPVSVTTNTITVTGTAATAQALAAANLPTPSTTTTGTYYYFYTMTGTSTCGSAFSLTSPTTLVTVSAARPYATLPFSETFESTWLSLDNTNDEPSTSWVNVPATGNNSWRRSDNTTGGGWTSPSGVFSPLGSNAGGASSSYSAMFNNYWCNAITGALYLYVNLPVGTKTISFDYINSDAEALSVAVSVNGGVSWTSIASITTQTTWATKTYTTTLASPTAMIRFQVTGNYGSYEMGIDNVNVCLNPTVTVSGAPGCTPASFTASGATTYTWSPATSLSATTGASVTATPTVTTTYTVTGASGACTATATAVANPMPAAIGGSTFSVCTGQTITLTDATAGGTWSVTPGTGTATISGSGVLTGSTAGTVTAVYTKSGCSVTQAVTVNSTPTVTVTGGGSVYCYGSGSPVALSASGTGTSYTWAPGTGLSATTGSSVSAAPNTITFPTVPATTTYTITSTLGSCTATATASVSTHVPATYLDTTLGGTLVCLPGGTPITALYSASGPIYASGGVYSSVSAGAITTVSSTGYVTGVSAGSDTIYYTDATCGTQTQWVTVGGTGISVSISPSPASYCTGGGPVTLTASVSPAGVDTFLWVSATGLDVTNAATVHASPASTTTYTVYATDQTTGCHSPGATVTVTNTTPSAITGGVTSICAPGGTSSSTTTWTDAGGTGTWSSSAPGVATIDATTGVINAVSAGIDTITYTVTSSGCQVSRVITVNALPVISVTPTSVTGCGSPVTLTASGASTYSWSPATGLSATTGASVTLTTTSALTHSVTGTSSAGCVAASSATTSYTNVTVPGISVAPATAAGCPGTISTLIASIPSNYTILYQTFNTSLTDSTGGTWTINNGAGTSASWFSRRASPGYSSVVTGDGSTYVEASPDALTTQTVTNVETPVFSTVGLASATVSFNQYCFSSTTYDVTADLEYSTNGTTWTQMANYLGVTTGTTTWTVGTPTSTVSFPAGALGQSTVYLRWNYNSTYGFYWAIDNVRVTGTLSTTPVPSWTPTAGLYTDAGATVPYTGTATTTVYAKPTTTTTYTAGVGSCGTTASSVVTVYPTPVIAFSPTIGCQGTPVTASGGATYTWAPNDATLSATTGATVTPNPTSSETYTLTASSTHSCTASATYVVNPAPAISVTPTLGCAAQALAASGAVSYSWLPNDGSLSATTGSGVTANPTTMATTYTVTGTDINGCTGTATAIVGVSPGAISGTNTVCQTLSTTLTDAVPGGVWTSSDTTIARVGYTTGVVTGVGIGSCTITYTLGTCAQVFDTVTVLGSPTFTINPTGCAPSASLTVSSSDTGAGSYTYTWLPNDGTLSATTGASVSASPAAIETYTVSISNGTCAVNGTSIVYPTVAGITGATSLCYGTPITLLDASPSGSWSSSATGVATVDAATGVVTGVSGGTVTISYGYAACPSTAALYSVTANTLPSTVYTGTSNCTLSGSAITLSYAGGGGTYTWSPATYLSATTGSSVTCTPTGNITYTVVATGSGGCTATTTLAVKALSSLTAETATATPASTCSGGTSLLTSTVPYSGYSLSTGTFGMVAISSPSTATAGDDATTTATIPFSFNFYGTNYTAINICSNGWVNFGASATTYVNYAFPNASAPLACIGIGECDLTTASTGTITYGTNGTTPNRLFIVKYNNVPTLSGTGTLTGEVILHETSNVIDVMISNSSLSIAQTIGVQNASGTAAVTAVNASVATVTSTDYKFTPVAFSYAWSPSSGLSASTGASVTATVTGATSYSVIATDAGSGCYFTGTTSVSVGSIAIGVTNSPSTCSGSTGTWTLSGPPSATVYYQINGGSTSAVTLNTSGVGTVTATVTTPTNDTLKLISVTSGSCTNSLAAGNYVIIPYCVCTPAYYEPSFGTSAASDAMNHVYIPSGASGTSINATFTPTFAGYVDETALTPLQVQQTNSYTGTVYYNASYDYYENTIWIDWNDNGTFEASENVTGVFGSAGCSASVTSDNFTMTIPITATLGTHRMRVRNANTLSCTNSTTMDPCAYNDAVDYYYYGCTADFEVTILPPSPLATVTPSSIAFSPTTVGTSSATSTISTTGLYLLPASGSLTVTAPAGFMIWNGTSWASSTTHAYTGGTLAATVDSVQFDPTSAALYSGAITVTGGGTVTSSTDTVHVTGTGAAPCTGTPTAGISTVSPTSGNAATSFTLTCSGYSVAGGIGFQWQKTTDTTTAWTSISGATLSTYTFTGITVNTYYRCVVSCSYTGLSANTYAVMAQFLPTPTCIPTSASWTSESSYAYGVNNISITGFSGSTLSDAGLTSTPRINTTTGYAARYSSVPVLNLQQNGSYSTSLTWGTVSSYQEAQIWIDFNNDGTFQTSEEVTGVVGFNSSATTSPTVTNINIPLTAATGTHLMRVRGDWESIATTLGVAPAHIDPCAIAYTGIAVNAYSGSIADYYVNIVALPPCSGTPSGGTTTASVSGGCASYTTSLSQTGGTAASGLTYQWYQSTDGITWSAISGATTYPYTYTSVHPTTYLKDSVTCTASGLSAASSTLAIHSTTPITGLTTVCQATTTPLSDSVSGGTWSSSATGIASVGSGTGIVTGGSTAGTATISYVTTGCTQTFSMTNVLNPSAITGTTSVCQTFTTTLANTVTGGTWSSANTAIATVDAATGVVTGVGVGTTTISYSTGCGTAATTTYTVYAQPSAIGGPGSVCATGAAVTMTDTLSGGTWSTSATTIGTIDASTGVFTPNGSVGSETITYTAATGGCKVTLLESAGTTPPSSITGTTTVCAGSSTTLADAVAGGLWSSSSTAVATVDASTGVVTGVNGGSTTITYNNGCGIATQAYTVNGTAYLLGYNTGVCTGATLSLTSGTLSGGTYSWTGPNSFTSTLQNPTIPSVGSAAIGTYSFSATLGGCATGTHTIAVTVAPTPTVTAVASPTAVCAGTSSFITSTSTTTLLAQNFNSGMTGQAGGTWTVTNTGATSVYNWAINAPSFYTDWGGTGDGTSLIGADPDLAGSTVDLITSLNAPAVSTVGLTSATLTFNYYCFSSSSYDVTADIEYSLDGTTWTQLYNYFNTTSGSSSWTSATPTQTITLPSGALGHPTVYLRWFYSSTYGFYWLLDNVVLTGYTNNPSSVWTPSTSLYTNSGLTTAYTSGSAAGSVYAVPSTTTTYTATVGACAATATATVNVNPLPAVYAVTGGGAYCSSPGTGVHIGTSNSETGVNYKLYKGATLVSTVAGTTGSPVDFGLITDTSGIYTVVGQNAVSGCTQNMTGSVTVTINGSPIAQTLTGGNGCSAAGVAIGLSGSQATASYQLYNGIATVGSAVTGTGSAISFGTQTAPGTYTIVATGTVGGCTTNMTGSSVISASPIAYNLTGGNGCSAAGVTMGISNSETGNTYNLYNGATLVTSASGSTGSAVSFGSITSAGSYLAIAVSGAGCSTNMNGGDTVYQTPSVTPGATPVVCQGSTSASLSYSGAVGAPTSYSLAYDATAHAQGFTDVPSASLPALSIGMVVPSAAVAGTYNATLTVYNANCTSSSYAVSVTISTTPTASITSASLPCTGHATNIIFTGTSGSTIGYQVDGGSITTATLTGGTYTLPTVTMTASHDYKLVYVSTFLCVDSINIDTVVAPIPMQWTGTADTNWSNSANWSCGVVPSISDDVTIPSGTPYAPSLAASGSASTHNLTIASGAVLNLNSSSTLNVKGNLTNNTSVTGVGTLSMNGTSAQTISGIGSIAKLDINNASGVSVTATSLLTVKNTLSISGGTFATADSFILGSDSVATARIAPITAVGAYITGSVRIQQYIPGGHRAFRFWGHPFTGSIALSQITKYIDITGTGGAANGFTPTITNSPSCFRYNPLLGNSTMGNDPGWKAFMNTSAVSDTNGFHAYEGIRLFIRGQKGQGLDGLPYTPLATTITMVGTVNQGPVTVSLVKKGTDTTKDYNQISNPYPSPVDIGTIAHNAYTSGQMRGSSIYIWDPYLGGPSGNGNWLVIPVDAGVPYYLQANSSFQIRANHNGATLNFVETNKAASINTNILREIPQYISLNIYDVNYNMYDMLYVRFMDEATDNEDNKYDAAKPSSPANLNFYSMSAEGKKLGLDSRPYEAGKVISLGISSTVAQDFIIKTDGYAAPAGAKVYLHDILLNTYTLLQQGTEYRFSITTDKSTQGDKRFELSVDPTAAVAANKALEVTMQPNPATDEVKISFTSGKKDNVNIRMMDLSGVSVYNTSLGLQQSGSVNVPLSNLASGIYMVELTQGDQKVVQRLVKE